MTDAPVTLPTSHAHEAALLRAATAMIKDPVQARGLVAQTLAKADETARGGHGPPASEAQLFRLLRQTYHSIERARGGRHAPPSVVAALALVNEATGNGQPR
jgi:hypothetical protein